MIYELDSKINFGQYYGLTIQQIYQGTLLIENTFIEQYLDRILNCSNDYPELLPEKELVNHFEITASKIIVHGDIDDCDKPYSKLNCICLGNIQKSLSNYINHHFRENMRGTILNPKDYNKGLQHKFQLGGDPDYIMWCLKNIDYFEIDSKTIDYLSKLPIAKWTGIEFLYTGSETFEYKVRLEIEYRQSLKINESDTASNNL